ncbi:MAG: DUF4199 domain-containing protein [Bacteroidia bacterium]|jgi:hypothetical protein|nr:DUF4199 domain-containing protein [Bacteroidia bacterium]
MAESVSGEWGHASKFALAAAAGAVALGIIVYVFGLSQFTNCISVLIFEVLLIFALRSWRGKRGILGLSYGEACGYSIVIILIYSLLIAIWAVVFFEVIAPEIIPGKLEQLAQKFRQRHINIWQFNTAVKLIKPLLDAPVLFLITLVGNVFILIILSLITAIFFIRKRASPFDPAFIPSDNPYSPYSSDSNQPSVDA